MNSLRLFGLSLVLAALVCLGAGCKEQHTKSFGDDSGTQPPAAAPGGGARVALLIGCGAYRANPALVLDTPVNDMKDLGTKLRALGFEVIETPDPTLEGFYSALAHFGDRAKGAGIAMFFYSGHGVEHDNQDYLIPVTATLEEAVHLRTQTVNLTDVMKTLEGTGAVAKLAVLDCCRNNPYQTTKAWLKTKSVREEVLRELGESEIPQSTMVCFATGAGRKAAAVLDNETERNSPFTALLLKELDVPGESIRTVFENVHDRLSKATGGRQAPSVKTDNALSEIFRETVLRPGVAATPAPANDPALAARIQELEKRLAAKEAERSAPVPPMPTLQELEKRLAAKQAKTSASASPAPAAVAEMAKLEPARPAVPGLPRATPQESGTVSATPQGAKKEAPYVNSLGMKFVPVAGTKVLFSVWDTRLQDYAEYAKAKGITPQTPYFEQWPRYQGPTHPVVEVSWENARAFCLWLSKKEGRTYRLPTDAEWSIAVGLGVEQGWTPEEKKTNGPTDVYPWGRQWPPPPGAGNYGDETSKKARAAKANAKAAIAKRVPASIEGVDGYDDGYAYTSPVGSFAANQNGLYDMGGNVWQWCEDWFNATQKHRVLRGGSWYDSKEIRLRSTYRDADFPTNSNENIGFRCILVISGS